jgi:glycosyltransferase involved in cell wall biosynthesis
MNFPSLSVLIINKNGGKKLARCLKEISCQDYPKELIEIIIVDGGSTDESVSIAKKYKAKFIDGGYPENQEARRFIAVKEAKNELIAWIDTDNYLPTRNWLLKMVEPLVKDKEIFASETWHYAYRKNDGGFNRYCSLFGINDPVAFYLGKADRATYYHKSWQLLGKAEDKGNYFKVTFKNDIPTVGCNGFLIRRSVLNKVITTPENYFHIDVIYDLILKGYRSIAFVKNDIIHDTSDRLSNLVKKRTDYFSQHGVKQAAERRYKVFDPNSRSDKINLLLFMVYTVTIIKPLFDSLRGFVRKPDFAWFLHPIVCWLFLYAYGMVILKKATKKYTNGKIREAR